MKNADRLYQCLKSIKDSMGCEAYVVGGAVRDLLRGAEPTDLDIIVRSVDADNLERELEKHGKVDKVGKSFGIFIFSPNGLADKVEIAFPRTERSTGPRHQDFQIICDPNLSLEEDSKRRDFTCNAMYMDIEDYFGARPKSAVLDYHGGIEHIKNRLVVAVGNPEERIKEDPLRMMRVAVLQAKTGFRLEGRTFAAIKKNSDLINHVALDRVRDELVKIMLTDRPSRALKLLHRTGVLRHVLPELEACVGVGQNPENHKYPVFEHCCYVADAACSLTPLLEVRFAGLFHDLGKAVTREVKPGGKGDDDVSFHNHEIVSERLVRRIMSRLRFSNEFTDRVVELVKNHQYKYDRAWTDRAVRRFIRSAGIVEEDLPNLNSHPLFILRQADRIGNGTEAKVKRPITQKQLDFQARIVEVYRASTAKTMRDLAINGKVLMEELNLKPSPLVGNIMQALFDMVEDKPELNNRDELLSRARKIVQKEEANNV